MIDIIEEEPTFGEEIAGTFGRELGALGQLLGQQRESSAMKSKLEAMGLTPQEADLYATFSKGGQTAFAKEILESRKRRQPSFGEKLRSIKQKEFGGELPIEDAIQDEEGLLEQELEDYLEHQDLGLTPAEQVRRSSERFKQGLPQYQEAIKKLHTARDDKNRLKILESIENTKKLPKNLGRINVDKEGNLRLAFASSPEAQRFVKTLNEFSLAAKDTFGARVTNFDLQQFMTRYPTLLNSADGRKQIYEQMKNVNEINSVYYKNLKKIYDRAGGVRNIDPDIAMSLAEQMTEPTVEKLGQKFEHIGEMEDLPNPAEHLGRIIIDDETGERLKSNGKTWEPVE